MPALIILIIIHICLLSSLPLFSQSPPRPNIILIITDDQGYGDFGFTGNPHVLTPHLDKLARESIRFTNFYVSPVCAPTRSSLLTGRYSLRTGVHDTYNGGAIMASEEITLAELLGGVGYQTGIFGKWHLGDNYPSRPGDQGFEESLIHLSGGMGQVGDFTTYFQDDSSYFDPVLWHNGEQEQYAGYCSDIFADAAIDFITQNKDDPFLCYLSFNAPHTPLQVPQQYLDLYADLDPSRGFDKTYPELAQMTDREKEAARRVYAMVSNIDDNIGKLISQLESIGIADNTLLIFMTDNGPQQNRYKAGLRGRKGSVYRGGVRVPLLVRYPNGQNQKSKIERVTAHMDILPTIADLCQIPLPSDRIIDGQSFLPALTGVSSSHDHRDLFFYWNRRYPEQYNNMAFQHGRYKLVGHTDYDSPITDFELYDLQADPGERNNMLPTQSEQALSLKAKMDSIYFALIQSPHIQNPPLIHIGNPAENPVILNRNDADGERGIWNQSEVYGFWNVNIQPGQYDIRFRFLEPVNQPGNIILEVGPQLFRHTLEAEGQDFVEMKNVPLSATPRGQLTAILQQGHKKIFPFWIELTRLDSMQTD